MALGKVSEIFLGRGVTSKIKIGSNAENLALLLGLLRGTSEAGSFTRGLLFTNLVDFDMVWGHRNDPDGFAAGLQAVDAALPDILATLGPQDRLVITADHGVDPTTSGTDHSREYVPLLYYPRPDGARDAVFEGGFADTGATAYAHLTGRMPTLAGRSLDSGEPERGWRHYPGSVPSPGGTGLPWPTKVTVGAATEAAAWLQERCGDAPSTAVVLGSGLSTALRGAHGRPAGGSWPASYDQVPGWKTGSVVGHPGILEVVGSGAERLALLAGRLHGYEGYDLGELQLGVRTMAAWGVKRLVLTCAAGGLSPAASPGTVVAVRQVLDVQHSDPQAIPMRLEGTSAFLLDRLAADRRVAGFVRPGVYAAVPGPQYETPAENDLLRSLGADCVGMSVAAELHAAREVGLDVAVFALVANAGAASHEEVVAAAELRGERLVEVVTAGLSAWEGR
jgi:inosine/guanosine/xanthosine phosphorylase family protein